MKTINYTLYFFGLLIIIQTGLFAQQTRDPYKQPFAATSPWNTPIGDSAVYVPAGLGDVNRMDVDEDYIVLTPNAPIMPILLSNAGWGPNAEERCVASGGLLQQVPMPKHFVISPQNWEGRTPNAGLAVLLDDGETIIQNQPFARCSPGKAGHTMFTFNKAVNLYEDGLYGAHGGSHLSAIGGAIRLGELVPGGEINHALKINVFADIYLSYNEEHKGFRWPATTADSYAARKYKGLVDATRMGSLLALPADLDIESLDLQTEPAKILARTLQLYGAYIVDDTAWDVYAIITEFSPEGRVKDEFQNVWGFPFISSNKSHPWMQDLDKIIKGLHVVDNNTPESVGGGGNPIGPLAPDFGRVGNRVPVVSLVSPHDYQSIIPGNTLLVKADAIDHDGSVDRVEFYAAGHLIGSADTEPYEINWEVDREGEFILLAKAIDNEGGVGLSQSVMLNTTVTAENLPTIVITSPVTGAAEDDGSIIELTVDVKPNDYSIQKVEWYADGYKHATIFSAPYSTDLTYYAIGDYTIRARLFTTTGLTIWSAAVTLSVDRITNNHPVVYMAGPESGSEFAPNARVTLHAEAYDPETALKSVGIYVNDVLLHEYERERYRYVWRPANSGVYKIHAVAEDMDGAITISEPITITITGTVSVDEMKTGEFLAYPNPVGQQDHLNIKLVQSFENVTVSLMDLTGRLVYQEIKAGIDEITIDMNKVKSGKGVLILKVDIKNQAPVVRNIIVY
jgi:hypothetical protein